MAFTASQRRSTLSDRFDPIAPEDPVPGGLIEDVSVSYSTSGERAVQPLEAIRWANAPDSDRAIKEVKTLLTAVQNKIESDFGLALVPQTVTVIARGPTRELHLPRLPFTSLTTVKEIVDGTKEDDISGDYYELHGVLRSKEGIAIGQNPVEVVYDAGYTDAPEEIKLAIKKVVTDHYDFRTDQVEESIEKIPRDAESILRSFID